MKKKKKKSFQSEREREKTLLSYIIIVKILKEEVVNCQWPTLSFPRRRWWWWIGFFCSFFFFVLLFWYRRLFCLNFPAEGKKKKRHTHTRAKSDDRTTSRTNQQHTTTDYIRLPTLYWWPSSSFSFHFFFLFFFFWDWVFDFADCYRNWPMECRPFSSLFWGCLLLLGHTE